MRKTALPLASIALALLASGVGLLQVEEPAEATFAGQNGNIAYMGGDGNDDEIYTTSPAGGPPFQVTNNVRHDFFPSYSPDGKKIAYTGFDGTDDEIYAINATGGPPIEVTYNDMNDETPMWGSRP
jgi:Tol biopolymer transport system component